MTSFLLKCHSDKGSLKTSLDRFERRVKSLRYPFQFLEHLRDVKMDNKVFYWPSAIDAMTVAEVSSSIPPGEKVSMDENNGDLHLYTLDVISLVRIIASQASSTTTQKLDEDDIVYPTFVHILYDRQLESMKKLMETQSKVYRLNNKSGNIQVYPNSGFLDNIETDLTTMSSAAIYEKHKRKSFTHFVQENRDSLNHFPASSITPHSHKAIFNLNGMIWDATNICGGSIILYPPSDRSAKYFVCLSDGYFHLEGNDSCNLYTQSTGDTHRMDGNLARWIDIAKFKKRQRRPNDESSSSSPSYCMLESSDKMVIRFNDKTRCLLYTSGRIHLDLKLVGNMEFWSPSEIPHFPFSYHIYSIRVERQYDFIRHLYNLPPTTLVDSHTLDCIRQFDDGSLKADMIHNEKTGTIEYLSHYMKLKNANRPLYDQHGSFFYSFECDTQVAFLRNMKIYFKPGRTDDIYPVFSTIMKAGVNNNNNGDDTATTAAVADDGWWSKNRKKRNNGRRCGGTSMSRDEEVELSIMKERYRVGENEYYVNGLYFPKKKDEIIAYFYLNPTNNHILFILPFASVSHTLNTEPIPFESEYSRTLLHIESNRLSSTTSSNSNNNNNNNNNEHRRNKVSSRHRR